MQNDGHLLLVDDVGGGGHVGFAVGVEYRGIYPFYGCCEHAVHLFVVVEIGYHVGRVYTGEGLVVRVFEQARRAHGDGAAHHFEEGQYVVFEAFGQGGVEKVLQDFLVGQVGEGHLVEVVALHEFVEDVGAEYNGLGHRYAHAFVIFEYGVALDE